MKITFIVMMLAALALPQAARAQAADTTQGTQAAEVAQKRRVPAARATGPAADKASPAGAKAASAVSRPAAASPAGRPAPAQKPAAQESEDSIVMIDSKAEMEETGSFSAEPSKEDRDDAPVVPGGLPSSYGQLKGTLGEGGRGVLVFESPEDGAITFVQVLFGKSGVSWKLIDRIPRSMD